jgi:hypothetical protein
LILDLQQRKDTWENPTLDRYLEAMAAWLDSAKNKQIKEPSWELIGDMFKAGKIYE